MIGLWMGLAFGTVPDQRPGPLPVETAETDTLAKGKIPVRFTDGGTGGGVVGIVDIDATPEAVWASVMDVKSRVGEISGLKEANIYEDTAARKGVQWILSVIGTRVEFNVLYDLDPANGWCRYRLDTSKTNDLVDVQGAYHMYRVGEKTRLVYRSETESGRWVPGFLKRKLSGDSVREQLTGIRARAEKR